MPLAPRHRGPTRLTEASRCLWHPHRIPNASPERPRPTFLHVRYHLVNLQRHGRRSVPHVEHLSLTFRHVDRARSWERTDNAHVLAIELLDSGLNAEVTSLMTYSLCEQVSQVKLKAISILLPASVFSRFCQG